MLYYSPQHVSTVVRSPPAYCTAVCIVTIPEAVVIQLVLLMMSSVLLETC